MGRLPKLQMFTSVKQIAGRDLQFLCSKRDFVTKTGAACPKQITDLIQNQDFGPRKIGMLKQMKRFGGFRCLRFQIFRSQIEIQKGIGENDFQIFEIKF